MKIEQIREMCQKGNIKWTLHVTKKLQERGIYREDVFNVLDKGKIIEDYPDDFPYPSCLVSGKDLHDNPLHVVIGSDGTVITIITAYFPDLDTFHEDYETRKERK